MNTELLRVDPVSPDPTVIARAAELLRSGRLVAFPTETVYGLGANALDRVAVRGIFAAKGRPATNPMIVHVSDPVQVVHVAAEWSKTAELLCEKFWPGPLTLVVPRNPNVPDEVTAGGSTVAVRCPNHPVARALIATAGVPIAAPSANRSTELSPTRAEHVLKSLNGQIDMVLDGGPCPGGIESTVVDVTGPVVRLLRPGLISVPMLEAFVGKVEVGAKPDPVARSPGQMTKHYSPKTQIVLVKSWDEGKWIQGELESEGLRAFFLHLRGASLCGGHAGHSLGMMPWPDEYAADLYAWLHSLDDGSYDRILIEMPPDTPEWAAVRDRLTRAAGCDQNRS